MSEETNLGEDGYAKLRRREMPEKDHVINEQFGVDDDGNLKKMTVKINNQCIVPYNPYFSYKFNCHINVEITTGIMKVKYLYLQVFLQGK